MSELLRETIKAAERVVAGEDSRVGDYVERLLSSPGELRSGEDSERVYLAALLDFIGLHEESVRVLRDAPDAKSRNMEGMLAAAHGQHERARNILVEALDASTDSPLPRKQILANLAAVSLQAGSVEEAEAWIEGAVAVGQARDPAVDVLIATVRASIASRRGNLQAFRNAATSLEEASKLRLADLGAEHLQALAIVANMASAEIMLARADNSAVRLERAIDVLEVAAFRLAAEFGVDHPQAKVAMASMAAARADRLERAAAAPDWKERVALALQRLRDSPVLLGGWAAEAVADISRVPGRRLEVALEVAFTSDVTPRLRSLAPITALTTGEALWSYGGATMSSPSEALSAISNEITFDTHGARVTVTARPDRRRLSVTAAIPAHHEILVVLIPEVEGPARPVSEAAGTRGRVRIINVDEVEPGAYALLVLVHEDQHHEPGGS